MISSDLRQQFPITQHYNFLNHAAIAPLSKPAADALRGYADEVSAHAYLDGTFYRSTEQTRHAAAQLINADPSEITFIKNTSEGINYVANGVQWATGDNVVINAMEFPANVYPWLHLEQRGVQVKTVKEEDGRIPFDRLTAAIDRRTRVLAISAVQWGNGFRTDLVRLGEVCKEKGVLLVVDAIQALGLHPLDVEKMNIDFLAADGHKWLCAPEGAGIFYCRQELIEHLRPTEPGYLCMRHSYNDPKREIDLHHDARRFDSGVYNISGIAALGASIKLLQEIGIANIQVRVKELTDRLADGVQSKGWSVQSPRTPSEWSGIVLFGSQKHDVVALKRHLREEFRIIVAHRMGGLRASPHVYNSEDEIDQLVDALPPESALRQRK
jgi:selenocysteine lyase/cysteine desulfurase